MDKAIDQTDSEQYSIKFGGIWLEFHERIASAEQNLLVAQNERDVAIDERNKLIIEKADLEDKYKRNVASLTRVETGHMEARQIFDKVRDEHQELSRRCLAAEAHTEWLEDQLKQQKVTVSIKDEEIHALLFRAEKSKAALEEAEATIVGLKRQLDTKGSEISSLTSTLRLRDDELLVLTRSGHSKDKQMSLMVRERNGLKEDLERTQRSLALARRTESCIKRRSIAQKLAEDSATQHSAACSPLIEASAPTGMSSKSGTTLTSAMKLETTILPTPTATTCKPSVGGSTPLSTVSVVGSVLRKYKSARAAINHKKKTEPTVSQPGTAQQEKEGDECGNSMLLEDILQSVLDTPMSKETIAQVSDGQMLFGLEASEEDSHNYSYHTPTTMHRKYHDKPSQQTGTTSASVLLDDADFGFITSMLEHGSPGPLGAPTNTQHTIHSTCEQDHALNHVVDLVVSDSDCLESEQQCASVSTTATIPVTPPGVKVPMGSVFDATIHKMLFGAKPPNPWGETVAVHTPISGGKSANKPTPADTPVTAYAQFAPSALETPTSCVTTDDNNNHINHSSISTQSKHDECTSTSTPTISTPAAICQDFDVVSQLHMLQKREMDYKAALYLLQEEVRVLRAQVTQHDAAKRVIHHNYTPKGVGGRKKTSDTHAGSVGSVPLKAQKGPARKLVFAMN